MKPLSEIQKEGKTGRRPKGNAEIYKLYLQSGAMLSKEAKGETPGALRKKLFAYCREEGENVALKDLVKPYKMEEVIAREAEYYCRGYSEKYEHMVRLVFRLFFTELIVSDEYPLYANAGVNSLLNVLFHSVYPGKLREYVKQASDNLEIIETGGLPKKKRVE